MFDYFEDFKRDDGQGTNSRDWGYGDDDYLRPNTDRYWLRLKHDQQLPGEWSAQLDLDVVSDQDYLNEFKSGLTGFDQTEAYFQETFGRDLDDYTDPVRVNRLYLSRAWSRFHLNAEARWFDDVIARRLLETDTTPHKLPRVAFNGSKQRLLETPLYFDLQSEYIHFYRLSGTRGHRADVHPRVYLPLRLKKYLTAEPSIGVRQTIWHLDEIADDGSEPDLAAGDRTLFRELFDLKLDLFTTLQKQYAVKSETLDRIQHRVRPQIVYEFIPGQAQSHLPDFDDTDRIAATNKVSYSLTNLWISRSTAPDGAGDPSLMPGSHQGTTPGPSYQYRPLARFKLEQSYDIEKASKGQPEPFSPLSAELTIDAFRFVSLDADAEWSFDRGEFDSHSVAVVARDRRGDQLSLEHRYTRTVSQSLIAGLNLNINEQLSAVASYERNLKTDKSIQVTAGMRYRSQCWSVEFRYSEEGQTRDRSYLMLINLHGLGSFSAL